MAIFRTATIGDPVDAARRLADFGLSVSQILAVRDSARAAYDDASPLMPLNAPGTLAYIHGVAALREQFLDSEWKLDRTLGVEAIINQKLGIRIGYQNVDQACDSIFKPLPRSSKGPGSEKMCSFPLFEFFGVALETDIDRLPTEIAVNSTQDNITTYFIMVGGDGSVELSSPIIGNKRYSDFRERIFVDRPGEDWDLRIEPESNPNDEFDIQVTFKDGV